MYEFQVMVSGIFFRKCKLSFIFTFIKQWPQNLLKMLKYFEIKGLLKIDFVVILDYFPTSWAAFSFQFNTA